MLYIHFITNHIKGSILGILKISDELHEELRQASKAMSRSINAQAEFWIKVGAVAELNPDWSYNQIVRKLLNSPSSSLKDLTNEQD